MCTNKNRIVASEITRKFGVVPKAAWFATQRIRETMASDSGGKMSGSIVVDETYVGGKPENCHANDLRKAKKGNSTSKLAGITLISDERERFAQMSPPTSPVRLIRTSSERTSTLVRRRCTVTRPRSTAP